jgi:SAM-dependent methyltransferase
MLPAIAAHAVTAYTQPGDLVLDPMCGIGTTLVEAIHLGRHAVGVEYEPRWAGLARLNAASAIHEGGTGTGTVHRGDARPLTDLISPAIHGHVDLVLTSPPYGNSVHGQVRSTRDSGEPGVAKKNDRYSHDPSNLAHVSTDRLLEAFTEILAQCRRLLRPGGTVVVTTRPWRERGELIDLPSAVLAAGQAAGLTPTERCVALLAGVRDGRLIARPSFFQMKHVRDARRQGIPLAVVQHEDVLIFTRPGKHAVRAAPADCRPRGSACMSGAVGRQGSGDSIRLRGCARGSRCGRY